MKTINVLIPLVLSLYLSAVYSNTISCDGNISYEKSLRSKGESLENFPTQNQGNIGSCYANSLTVALYPIVGFEVSPNFLAIQAHKNDKGSEITGGGDSCTLFKEVKNIPLCSTDKVPLDRKTQGGIDIVLDNLGAFFDDYNNNEINGSDFFKRSAQFIQSYEDDALINAEMICDAIFSNPKQFLSDSYLQYSTLSELIQYAPEYVMYNQKNGAKKQKNFDELFFTNKKTGKLEGTKKYVDIITNNHQELTQTLSFIEDEEIKLEIYRDNIQGLYEDLQIEPGSALFVAFETWFKGFNSRYPDNEDFLFTAEFTFSTTDYDICVNQKVLKYFEEEHFLNEFVQGEVSEDSCQDNEQLGRSYLGMIKGLEIVNGQTNDLLGSMQELQRFLKDNDPTLENFMTSYIISKDCNTEDAKKGVKSTSEMSCKNISSILKEDEFTKIEDKKSAFKSRFNKLVATKLSAGNPIIVDFCTAFFTNPEANIDLDSDKCENLGEEHGLHSMALIGQRCKNGTLEYQIQNSWGKDCDYIKPTDENGYILTSEEPLYDCDPQTGSFWISESVLTNNIFDIGTLD